jgi:hypothetical protein
MPRDPEYLPPQTPEPLHSELLDKILRNNPAFTRKEARAMLDQFFWLARPIS